jgi:hypothetical protein
MEDFMANEINFAAIPQTAIKVLTAPAAFFREMPKVGGFVEPLIFAIALGCVAGIIKAIVMMGMYFSILGIAVLSSIILMPIFITIGCFIGAAILFVIWKLMGSQESYETAFRCAAYMSAISPITAVIGFIPYLGGVIALLIGLYFIVIASTEVHGIPAQKAWLVFGIVVGILCLMSLCSQYAARKAVSNIEMTSKAMQNYVDQAKAMQQAQQQQQQQQQANK